MPATASPPGPTGNRLLGNVREFRQGTLAFYTRCAREFGDVVQYRLGPRRVVLVNHPDLIEQVLVTENRKFIKHYGVRLLRPTLGDGLLTSDGDFWLRQRRLMQPAFQKQRIETYAGMMVDATQKMLARWRPGESRDLHADMMQLALSIVSQALLDVDAGDKSREAGQAIEAIMQDFNSRFQSALPPPFWLPIPRNFALRRQVRRLDAVINEIIRERRRDTRERGDLLSVLIRARDEHDQTGMTDRQLRDEVMTLFLAGHETTANALAWTWYLLASHPAVEARLLDEFERVLAGRPPCSADVSRLPYTEQVILESMRLYPPAYVIGRETVEDVTLGGYRIPPRRSVIMSQWVMHRDPRFFERPEEFDPDRWSDGLLRRLPKYAYFPFGGGPRVCIGNSFALLETLLVVATVVPRFQFSLAADCPVVPWPSVTLRPQYGIRAVVRPRAARRTAPTPDAPAFELPLTA